MTKKRISREQRRDWRNLPYSEWNTVTIHAYFEDMNRERFGIEKYTPMRNWRFEQGTIRRALDEHGAELLHRAFDEIFRTYRPSREYPLLTAGFAICYRLNTLIPKIQAEIQRERSEMAEAENAAEDTNTQQILDYLRS